MFLLLLQFGTSVQHKTLDYITDDLVKTGHFLRGFHSDSKKLKCLEMFIEHQDLVKWIRQETESKNCMSSCDFNSLEHVLFIPDVRNLQHFVTISLATAVGGEGDYARDKLSRLRTVGGGFEELIYKLPPDTGYKDLEKKCEGLWVTLKNTPDLPDLLVCDFSVDEIIVHDRICTSNMFVIFVTNSTRNVGSFQFVCSDKGYCDTTPVLLCVCSLMPNWLGDSISVVSKFDTHTSTLGV